MQQAREKQLENDVSGGTDRAHIKHHCQDNMCNTTTIEDELTNDDGSKIEKGEQGGGKAIHARHGNKMQAMTEEKLRRLMEENSGKYVVYDGKRDQSNN